MPKRLSAFSRRCWISEGSEFCLTISTSSLSSWITERKLFLLPTCEACTASFSRFWSSTGWFSERWDWASIWGSKGLGSSMQQKISEQHCKNSLFAQKFLLPLLEMLTQSYWQYVGTITGARGPHFRFPNYPKYSSVFLDFTDKYVFLPADSKYDRKICKKTMNIRKNMEFIFQIGRSSRPVLPRHSFFDMFSIRHLSLISEKMFTRAYASLEIIRELKACRNSRDAGHRTKGPEQHRPQRGPNLSVEGDKMSGSNSCCKFKSIFTKLKLWNEINKRKTKRLSGLRFQKEGKSPKNYDFNNNSCFYSRKLLKINYLLKFPLGELIPISARSVWNRSKNKCLFCELFRLIKCLNCELSQLIITSKRFAGKITLFKPFLEWNK